MPTIRSLTPPINAETDIAVKLQVWVSTRDKRTILMGFGDDGVYTFVIRTQFQRLATFIRDNDLSCDSPADIARAVEFVRNGSDTRPDRTATKLDESGTASRLQHQNAATTSKPVSIGSGRAPGVGGKSVKTKK